MKTPDTEWEKELREKLKDFGSRCYWYGEETGDYDLSNIEQYEPETLDKIMNLLSSRDTYWKERVIKLIWDMDDRIDAGDSWQDVREKMLDNLK